jgi:hypothetical protein
MHFQAVDDEDMFANVDELIHKLERPRIEDMDEDSDDDNESHRYFSGAENHIEPLFSNDKEENWGVALTNRALSRGVGVGRGVDANMLGMIIKNLPAFKVDAGLGVVAFADSLAKAVKKSARAILAKKAVDMCDNIHGRAVRFGSSDVKDEVEEEEVVEAEFDEEVVVEDVVAIVVEEVVEVDENITPSKAQRNNYCTPQKNGHTPKTSASCGTNFGSFAARGAGSLKRDEVVESGAEGSGVPSAVNPRDTNKDIWSSASSLSLHDEEEDEMLGDEVVVLPEIEEEEEVQVEHYVESIDDENHDPRKRVSTRIEKKVAVEEAKARGIVSCICGSQGDGLETVQCTNQWCNVLQHVRCVAPYGDVDRLPEVWECEGCVDGENVDVKQRNGKKRKGGGGVTLGTRKISRRT